MLFSHFLNTNLCIVFADFCEYYENLETGNVTWDAPECFAGGDSANQWVKHYDKTRRQPVRFRLIYLFVFNCIRRYNVHFFFLYFQYYENLLTGKTTWDQPEGFSAN